MPANWSVDDMVKIVSFGGGLEISAKKVTVDDAVKIASFAGKNAARVIFRDTAHWSVNDAVKIASFGKGSVVFAD